VAASTHGPTTGPASHSKPRRQTASLCDSVTSLSSASACTTRPQAENSSDKKPEVTKPSRPSPHLGPGSYSCDTIAVLSRARRAPSASFGKHTKLKVQSDGQLGSLRSCTAVPGCSDVASSFHGIRDCNESDGKHEWPRIRSRVGDSATSLQSLDVSRAQDMVSRKTPSGPRWSKPASQSTKISMRATGLQSCKSKQLEGAARLVLKVSCCAYLYISTICPFRLSRYTWAIHAISIAELGTIRYEAIFYIFSI
jgi:hypothetical protein